MGRYYFNVWDGTQLFDDEVGHELGTQEAARQIAIAMLPGLCGPFADGQDWQEVTITVRDEDGSQILTTRLSVRAEWHTRDSDAPVAVARGANVSRTG